MKFSVATSPTEPAGAPDEIIYVSKPHIGTFRLVTMVESMRAAIEEARRADAPVILAPMTGVTDLPTDTLSIMAGHQLALANRHPQAARRQLLGADLAGDAGA